MYGCLYTQKCTLGSGEESICFCNSAECNRVRTETEQFSPESCSEQEYTRVRNSPNHGGVKRDKLEVEGQEVEEGKEVVEL